MSISLLCTALAAAWALVEGPQGTVKAELFSAEHASLPVAKVDNRIVTLQELSDALSAAHEQHSPAATHGGKKDFSPVLDRLMAKDREQRYPSAEALLEDLAKRGL